ncbi:uncharacterized protein L201_004899 [Kwoniella dendrophila CBS 6074]|uniref:SWIM-type domain-containing protein n=1 Tax=Kwoniella dendrophila CBS 6074 TaxID=1295534 RepID=A0AAX4JZK1_9TREE
MSAIEVQPAPRRRSARISAASALAHEQATAHAETQQDIKPSPPKKQKTRARKSAVVSDKTSENVTQSTDLQTNGQVRNLSAAVNAEQDDTPPVNPLAEMQPVKIQKKRGRPSKTAVKGDSSAYSPTNTIVKSEGTSNGSLALPATEIIPVAGPSQTDTAAKNGAGKQKTSAKGKAKVEKAVDPKKARMARLREKCPKTILDRYKRAVSQRMFMIERERLGEGYSQYEQFKVLGSTGNVYTVEVGRVPRCDCPDNLKGNKPCKHIIFVFIKVLKVPDDASTWYQMSLTAEEVEAVFASSPPIPNGSVTVDVKVHKAFLHATGRGGEDEEVVVGIDKEVKDASEGKRMDALGEDCPVCYDEMTQEDIDGKKLTYDETDTGCGKPLHSQCFEMWAKTAKLKGNDVTCVWCRSPWSTEHGGQGAGNGKAGGPQYTSGGYLNMAAEAGMSRQRDVSTYHWGNRYRWSD